MTFEEDYYERGWRDALAFAAKQGRAMAAAYRRRSKAHEGEEGGWHWIADEGAATGVSIFAVSLRKASKKPRPKPEPTDAEAAEFPEGFTK